MPIWCAHDYRTKRIVVAEEIEAEMEMETERKSPGVTETIADAVIIQLMIVDDELLFYLASSCRIEGELFHLSAQTQSFQWDPKLHQRLLFCNPQRAETPEHHRFVLSGESIAHHR